MYLNIFLGKLQFAKHFSEVIENTANYEEILIFRA